MGAVTEVEWQPELHPSKQDAMVERNTVWMVREMMRSLLRDFARRDVREGSEVNSTMSGLDSTVLLRGNLLPGFKMGATRAEGGGLGSRGR